MRKDSIKNIRVSSEVQKELSLIIDELQDPRIAPMTTITEARVTPDLKYCTVYVSVLGDKKACEETMEGLHSAMGYIRRELASRVNMRITPEIRFIYDKSLEYGNRMSQLIDEVIKKDEQASSGN